MLVHLGQAKTFAVYLFICLVTVCVTKSVSAEQNKISVIYPEVRSAYAKVFTDINAGINQTFTGRVDEILINRNSTGPWLDQKIKSQQPQALIALGKSSLNLVESLNPAMPILAGAIIGNGGNVAGISMVPDAITMMRILVALKPNIHAVYVVGGKKSSASMVAGAQEFLKGRGASLKMYEADNVQEGAKIYGEILDVIKEGEVIWILPGAPNLDSSVFSLLLEVAWDKQLVVFSSNPSHASRGALFSVYPDNEGMGRTLGKMASLAINKSAKQDGLIPVQDLFIGVNRRTAKHLGINLQNIDLDETKKVVFAQ